MPMVSVFIMNKKETRKQCAYSLYNLNLGPNLYIDIWEVVDNENSQTT